MRTATAHAAHTLHAPVTITREFERDGARYAEVTTLPGGVGGWSQPGKKLLVKWSILRDVTSDEPPVVIPGATAMRVVDLLAVHVYGIVAEVNRDSDITPDEFTEAFQRTFAVALVLFLNNLTAEDPEVAKSFTAAFREEFESGRWMV